MREYRFFDFLSRSNICLFAGICLSGCASQPESPIESPTEQVVAAKPPDNIQKSSDSEKQVIEKQRQCLSEKKKLETALKDSQKQNDELKKKLDALLTIDRDLRSRGKGK